jgi:hypothetical protein
MGECTWYEVAGHLVYGVRLEKPESVDVEHSAHAGVALECAG